MSAADLAGIAHLEAGNPLVLWKYAYASDHVRQIAGINRLSELDEFHLYRKNRYSYYLSDEKKSNLITILPGYAGLLRQDLRHSRDWHWVRSFRLERAVDLTEVTLLHSDSEIPIYVTKASRFVGAVEVLVEGLPLPIWITNVRFPTQAHRELREIYAQIAEAIGYWLWQFTPSLLPAFESLPHRTERLLIEVALEEPEAWHRMIREDQEEAGFSLLVDPDTCCVRIAMGANVSRLLQGPNNAGEREMMREVLHGCCQLLRNDAKYLLAEASVQQIIDRHAPLGVKKKLLFFDSNSVPEIIRDGLPHYRPLQEADENELLDELGEHLRRCEGLTIGPIPNDRRTTILQKAVAFFYEELRSLVATLDPNRLLEWLVARHEAAVRHSVFHALTIPTRLACFSSEPEMIKQLDEETPRDNLTAISNRFIIEFVTAQPPRGLRQISLSVYDRLQALASRIIDYGSESDLIHFGLVDYTLEILPSGRLGADRRKYDDAHAQYTPTVMLGDIRRSSRSFESIWREGSEPDETAKDRWSRLDVAAVDEFGFSLMDQREFIATAFDIGQEIGPGVARLTRLEFIKRMSESMNWSVERIEQILEMLSSVPRPHFLTPGGNYRREDVYPWRYNRALSYLRRPFLIRCSGPAPSDVEVLWGIRHLQGFWKNMVALCTEGRLKAQTKGMIEIIGELNHARGDRFNKRVVELFNGLPHLVVREKVKKIGTSRLCDQKGDLGDIDVLVADKRRKRLLVVECKDLALARTPFEMSGELRNLFEGTEKKKSIVLLHERRMLWVQNHLREVLSWLGIGTTKWTVESLIVVDREMFTPYLKYSIVQIIPIETLRDGLAKQGWPVKRHSVKS
jgi:hypothetical protein